MARGTIYLSWMERRNPSILAVLATAFLVIVSVSLVLAAAEVALRAGASSNSDAAEAPPLDPELEGLPVLNSMRDLSQPNVRGVLGNMLYRTNSHGFRGREYSLEAPPNTFRIVLIGDSYAMGWKVSEEDTYAVRLETSLNAAGGERFEVLNLGISGLNIRQVILRLQRTGLAFEPNLIVYGYTLNDAFQRVGASNALADQRREQLSEWSRYQQSPSHLLRAFWPRWVALRNSIMRFEGSLEQSLETNYSDPEVVGRIDQSLYALENIARKRGICAVMLVHTEIASLRLFHPFTAIYDKMEGAALEHGIHVVQSYPYYRWHDSTALRVSAVDSHPNAEGHRLLADALLDGLRELPAQCGLGPIAAAP
jgi:lysophospholipase L1-like esterase